MTEEEWRASTDPRAMCEFVRTATTSWKTRWMGWMRARRFQVSARKRRLIELAKVEQVARGQTFSDFDELLLAARQQAEGRLGPGEARSIAEHRVFPWLEQVNRRVPRLAAKTEERACVAAAAMGYLFLSSVEEILSYEGMIRQAEERARWLRATELTQPGRLLDADLADDIRDILGRLFAAETVDLGWLAGNGGSARRVVEAIDATGEYHDLPVLADALEDAGCGSEALLSHCRQPTRHVRGCWVVDLLLGKE